MPDSWQQIFGKDQSREYGAISHPSDPYAEPPKTSVPRVVEPVCERHCSGRHQIDGEMRCPQCQGVGYHVTLHEYAHMDGHWFSTLTPVNGSPAWSETPEYAKRDTPRCRECGVEFERV